MKTNEQLLNEITAAMADAWLAACDRRVIGTTPERKHVVIDLQGGSGILFGPASGDECRLFMHRSAALDVLFAIGTGQVAAAARIAADGKLPAALNG
jgi:hypothetical protein